MSTARKLRTPARGQAAYDAIEREAFRLQRAGCFVSFMSDVTVHDRAALLNEAQHARDHATDDAVWVARPCGSHLVWLPRRPDPDPLDGSVPRWRREWHEAVAYVRTVLDTFGPGQFCYRLDVPRGTLRPLTAGDLDRIDSECDPDEQGGR